MLKFMFCLIDFYFGIKLSNEIGLYRLTVSPPSFLQDKLVHSNSVPRLVALSNSSIHIHQPWKLCLTVPPFCITAVYVDINKSHFIYWHIYRNSCQHIHMYIVHSTNPKIPPKIPHPSNPKHLNILLAICIFLPFRFYFLKFWRDSRPFYQTKSLSVKLCVTLVSWVLLVQHKTNYIIW